MKRSDDAAAGSSAILTAVSIFVVSVATAAQSRATVRVPGGLVFGGKRHETRPRVSQT